MAADVVATMGVTSRRRCYEPREFGKGRTAQSLALLELENLHVALEDGTEIVKGVDLVEH